jgi:hypothetical protein
MNDHDGLFDEASNDPNQHDYDQLEAIHAHTDGSSTIASAEQQGELPASADGRPDGPRAVLYAKQEDGAWCHRPE